MWARTRQKAPSSILSPSAAGPPHVSAYLRTNERSALKEAVGDLLGTDRCALQLIVFLFPGNPCPGNILRGFQGKDPVGRREDTSDSHSFSITARHNMYSSTSTYPCHCMCTFSVHSPYYSQSHCFFLIPTEPLHFTSIVLTIRRRCRQTSSTASAP